MIGYIQYSRVALLPIGKKIRQCRFIYSSLTEFNPNNPYIAKVFFEKQDILNIDRRSAGPAFYVSHFTILELV